MGALLGGDGRARRSRVRRVRRALRAQPVRLPSRLALAVPGAVLAATFVVAVAAAPNNWDSMVYHNARVMEWWDHGSVAPWDTPSERQVRMPPLASYFKLAFLGLTGDDRLFNLVQWGFFAFAILATAGLAARLVPSGRAGPWAALIAATVPMAILQSTSTQNDVVVAGYFLAAAFFLVRAFAADAAPAGDLALAGAAVGLGLATKGTAYLFLGVLARCRPSSPCSRGSRSGVEPSGARGRRDSRPPSSSPSSRTSASGGETWGPSGLP